MLAALLVVMVCLATAFASEFVRMEAEVNTFSSSRWLKEKTISGDESISAVFVLKHNAMAVNAFERNLLNLATPSSKEYGQWLKVRE
jgi:hypothetical protein